MARILRSDHPFLAGRIAIFGRWFGLRLFLEHASDGRDAKMETGPGKDLGDLHFPEHRTKGLQLLDHIPYEIRISVHRHGQLDQGIRALLVDTFEPGGDGFGRYQESLGCLLQRTSCGLLEVEE